MIVIGILSMHYCNMNEYILISVNRVTLCHIAHDNNYVRLVYEFSSHSLQFARTHRNERNMNIKQVVID